MQTIVSYLPERNSTELRLVVALSVVGATYALGKLYLYRKKKRSSYPNGVVILHQYAPNTKSPSSSPSCLTLETWLRIVGIKYQNEYKHGYSYNRARMPWITYNEDRVFNSELCIEYLSKKLDKDLSSNLIVIERAIARAFLKLCDESLYWSMLVNRFTYNQPEDINMSWLRFKYERWKSIQEACAQGYGRHSIEQLNNITMTDLKSLERFIGAKKYLFGDRPCNEDAAVFAIVNQFICLDKGPINQFVIRQCPKLVKYHDNIKHTFWPDWDQVLSKRQ